MKQVLRTSSKILQKSPPLLWSLLLLVAFGIVSIIAVQTTVLTTQQQEELRVQNTREALLQFVTVWEEGVLAQTEFWFSMLENNTEYEQLETKWQQSTPWLEDVYLWKNEQWTYPIQPSDLELSSPCLQQPVLWMDCSDESIEIQNQASLLKAQYWLTERDLERAQFELLSARPALRTPLSEVDMSTQGLSAFIERRILLFQLETLGAPLNGGQSLLSTSLSDLFTAHPAVVQAVLNNISFAEDIYTEIQPELSRLKRRQRMWNIVRAHKDRAVSSLTAQLHPLLADQMPLLFIHKTLPSDVQAVIVLDVPTLMATLTTQREGFQPIISDANNQPVAPVNYAKKDTLNNTENGIQIPGPQLFPQYRITMLSTPSASLQPRLLMTLAPILLAGILGIIGVYGSWRADQQQKALLQRQQEFIARITHELKTPLAGIRLMAESLEMTGSEDDMPFVHNILSESTRLEERIDEVLQVAKDTEIKRLVRIDTEILLTELYDLWLPRFQEIKGVLRTECDAVEIMGDELLLKDAIQNLLSNAIKYRNPTRQLRCVLSMQASGKWLTISLTDNGIGVPQAERKRIFERFVRVEGDNRGLSGGHGLGLAFVAETAKAHQGWIRCQDGLQGGVKITFSMPIVAS